ncbi:MAG: zf-HC2 domain-containing protein [Pseudomonadota bacterium]
MNCQDFQKFSYLYMDGEFVEGERVAMAAHLQNCQECRRVFEFEEKFRKRMKSELGTAKAPKWLHDCIHSALKKEERGERPWRRRWFWRFGPVVAAVVLLVGMLVNNYGEVSNLAEQTIKWHQKELPLDVAGHDPDVIGRFFRDKVPFAVHPPDLGIEGARLVGARLTSLNKHQAAYLMYELGKRRVSVFVMDSGALPAAVGTKRVGQRDVFWRGAHGYNVALYRSGGQDYAVASDLEPRRMIRLISTGR